MTFNGLTWSGGANDINTALLCVSESLCMAIDDTVSRLTFAPN